MSTAHKEIEERKNDIESSPMFENEPIDLNTIKIDCEIVA
jgi:hypothetical protein